MKLMTLEEKQRHLRPDGRRRGGGFLGAPCACGWALDELDERDTRRGCAWCGRVWEKRDGYWVCTSGPSNGE